MMYFFPKDCTARKRRDVSDISPAFEDFEEVTIQQKLTIVPYEGYIGNYSTKMNNVGWI